MINRAALDVKPGCLNEAGVEVEASSFFPGSRQAA